MTEKLSAEGLKAAADFTKQVITLSTGVIALTITFLEKIVQSTASGSPHHVPATMFSAWILFGTAIVAGVFTLAAIAGTLDALDRKQNGMPLNSSQEIAVQSLGNGVNITFFARVMGLCFVVGMACTIATGFL